MALNKKNKIDEAGEAAKKAAENGEIPSEFKDPYDVGARPAEGGKELRQWKKRVKTARKRLRKDLKEKGIRKKQEFEQIAWEMGLTLEENRRGLIPWLLWKLRWLATHLGFGTLLAAAGVLLAVLFLASYMTDHAGAFTINLTSEMLKNGFVLSEDEAFSNETSRLRSEKTKDINNITIEDVEEKVDETDGSHNGKNYVAYTFYIRNVGDKTQSYRYALNIGSSSLGVNEAVWIMLFEDGHQVVYAKPSADGDPEGLLGYDEKPPFYELAYDQQEQYYEKGGEWGIRTTPFANENAVVYGYIENVLPQETHKYTVVIWLEGNDPECVDAIFGGHAAYSMEFDTDDGQKPKKSIFSGVWRTEYDDYADYAAEQQLAKGE